MVYQEKFSNPFHTIPRKKLDEIIVDLKEKTNNSLEDKRDLSKIIQTFHKYYNANIPVDYWFREIDDKFMGGKGLVKHYNNIAVDIRKAYVKGVKLCFAGVHGSGKTMTCACILKRAVETNRYNALYVNFTDIINVLASTNDDNKQTARKLLLEIDFLVIDEVDTRYIGSDKAADLFGRIFEPIIRTRIQNQLPLFMCTNSPNITDGFSGALEVGINSLMNVIRIVPVLGKDYREVLRGR